MQRSTVASALAAIVLALIPASLHAQTFVTITVEDSLGAALQGAAVTDSAGALLGHSDQSGILRIPCAIPCAVHVTAPDFVAKSIELRDATVIRLEASAKAEELTVTAYRTPLGLLDSPVVTRLLSQSELQSAASVTLDGELRQLPGLELFRRSSALVANPSSQGISLRALGSTSASRTLVMQDDVPLNDAFAGTIHWLEPQELTIKSVEVMRGGGSDLYGSSAIGGVVSLLPVRPVSDQAELKSSYGAEGTFDDSLMLQTKRGRWGLLTAGGVLGTDGYIQEAPAQRGPVDIASNVHSQNGVVLVERTLNSSRIFVRGSGFNEARSNGTPYQTNGTRIWRYATGDDWQGPHGGTLVMRAYGSTEHFRQTFSSISSLPTSLYPTCSFRCGETPTKFSLTPNNELGAAAHWSQPLGAGLLLLAGADVRDIRVWDGEQSFGSKASITNLRDHQRDSAAYAETMWVRKGWIFAAGARMDWFQNYDGRQLLLVGTEWTPSSSQPSQFDQRFFDPRVGLSKRFLTHWSLSASGFRAFREPTPNELYRSTQVGNALTTPNGSLLSERATGGETGVTSEHAWGSVRASYFFTQVNRPITAVTINSLSSPILLKRENLGQIESRGVSVDSSVTPCRWLAIDGGYQYARATVTQGSQDLGNWIPEVARNLATTNLHAQRRALGDLNLQARWSGRQFDDDANAYLLHGYFRLDAFVSHDFGKRVQFSAAGENLLNRQIEISKTPATTPGLPPTTTLGMPRALRLGLVARIGRIVDR